MYLVMKTDNSFTPVRVQRKRTKGWKMPPNTVYVGRPTKWGNPYKVGGSANITPQEAVNLFEKYIAKWADEDEIKEELKGKNLACFCKEGEPCHADILLKIANQ
jgi:hypothetical protein